MNDGAVAPWPITVPRPTVAMAVACPAEAALGALRRALEAEGYRVASSVGPAGFEASRTSWKDLLGGSLPQRAVVTAAATPGPAGTVLRVGFPTGGNDWGARQRAARILTATAGTLRGAGVTVQVGEWESGLDQR